MAEKKLSEELRHCLRTNHYGDCQYHEKETIVVCPTLLQKVYERIKEYEEMEEQGILLKLPVAIGEEMFFIFMDCPEDYKEEYCKDHEGYCEKCPHREPKIVNRTFGLSDIPNLYKIIAYSTLEQAEQALKEMKGKNGN